MLVNKVQRFQHINLVLSAILAVVLITLTCITRYLSSDDEFRKSVHAMQMSLDFVKPSQSWYYNNTWKSVGNISIKHKIYSAYFDRRIDIIENLFKDKYHVAIGSVRIFAVLTLTFHDHVTCVFRQRDFSTIKMMAVQIKPLFERKDMKYAAFTIVCPVYKFDNEAKIMYLPQEVSITYPSNALTTYHPTFIPISYPRNMDQLFAKSQPILSVCVAPLQRSYRNVLRIAEFVEMYRLLGAKHFYFYYDNHNRDVKRLLKVYRKEGIADVLPWNLDNYQDDLHFNGIIAQINDCSYRAMVVDNYRHAAIVDLDQILMPINYNTLTSYLRKCDKGRTSAFVFRNVFFYMKDRNDTYSTPIFARNRLLYSQTKVRRADEIKPVYAQSKCIINTHSILEMGRNRMWKSISGYSEQIVPPSIGILHHYSDKCYNCRAMLVIDYTARRFGSLIWDRVDEICLQAFFKDNGICPTN
uniref:Glycosyltransferase family 92 protein n=1 Tax=Glossina brevipalpis TaxID=37001 RepID=A0A1A9WYT5_9MUSC